MRDNLQTAWSKRSFPKQPGDPKDPSPEAGPALTAAEAVADGVWVAKWSLQLLSN